MQILGLFYFSYTENPPQVSWWRSALNGTSSIAPEESPLWGNSASIEQNKHIHRRFVGFRWLSNHSQVDCGLHDHFATTVAHLLPSCITAVAFVFSLFTFPLSMHLYNNAAKIFGAERVLRRRLENLEDKMVYTTRGKCSIYWTSRVSVFFLKKVFARRRLCRRLCWTSSKQCSVALDDCPLGELVRNPY